MNNYEQIVKTVEEYPRKYFMGFTDEELKEVIEMFPGMNMHEVEDVLFGNTGAVIDGKFLTYPIDLINALVAGHGGVYFWD